MLLFVCWLVCLLVGLLVGCLVVWLFGWLLFINKPTSPATLGGAELSFVPLEPGSLRGFAVLGRREGNA